MKSYANLFYYSFLTILMYPYELLVTLIDPLLEIGLLTLFWNMIAQSSSTTISVKNLVVYFIIVQFISAWSISPSGLSFGGAIGKLIKRGELTQYLIRPMPSLSSFFFRERGYWVVDMIYALAFLIVAIVLIGDVSPRRFLFFLLFLGFSFIISLSICILIGSIAFITKEINGIRHSFMHFIRLLSGTLVPLTFFPHNIQDLLRYTPFPSMMFAPITILQNESALDTIGPNILISLAWSIILLSAALYTWNKGMKNYEAIGI